MRILLDECVTRHLKPYLAEYDVSTVREIGWSGIKNGKLMRLCAEAGFDVLLTIDKNLQYQQNLEKYPLSIIVLNCANSKVEELAAFLPALHNLFPTIEKHRAYLLDK